MPRAREFRGGNAAWMSKAAFLVRPHFRRLADSLARRLASVIAPPICALCGGDGQQLGIWGLDLCLWCEQACRTVPDPCLRCAEPGPHPGGESICGACRLNLPPFDAAHCLFRYEDPADLMITRLKFQHELVFARVLGTLFARALQTAAHPLPDALVPLPLHPLRLRDRGFNQTREIARHLARRLKLPLRADLLLRTRHTRPQSDLSAAERAANLQDAFRVNTRLPLPETVALLDDVMTTGHTAGEAAGALKRAGCRRVEIWACARAARGPYEGGAGA